MRILKSKKFIVVMSLVLVAMFAVGGTLAYMFASSNDVTNTFSTGEVKIHVDEKIEGEYKKDVNVVNDSDVPVYIRVKLVYSWVDAEGNTLAKNIVVNDTDDADVKVIYASNTAWVEGADGYWYYKNPVPVDESTENLIESAQVMTATETENIKLDVLAQGIQAKPANAIVEAWENDYVTIRVGADGTLSIGGAGK